MIAPGVLLPATALLTESVCLTNDSQDNTPHSFLRNMLYYRQSCYT